MALSYNALFYVAANAVEIDFVAGRLYVMAVSSLGGVAVAATPAALAGWAQVGAVASGGFNLTVLAGIARASGPGSTALAGSIASILGLEIEGLLGGAVADVIPPGQVVPVIGAVSGVASVALPQDIAPTSLVAIVPGFSFIAAPGEGMAHPLGGSVLISAEPGAPANNPSVFITGNNNIRIAWEIAQGVAPPARGLRLEGNLEGLSSPGPFFAARPA